MFKKMDDVQNLDYDDTDDVQSLDYDDTDTPLCKDCFGSTVAPMSTGKDNYIDGRHLHYQREASMCLQHIYDLITTDKGVVSFDSRTSVEVQCLRIQIQAQLNVLEQLEDEIRGIEQQVHQC